MAVLQTTGPISLADVASTLGGTAPHSLSEYYRGGIYVYEGNSIWRYRPEQPALFYWSPEPTRLVIYWDGVNIMHIPGYPEAPPAPGYTYETMTYVQTAVSGTVYTFNRGALKDPARKLYEVSRTGVTLSGQNSSVPTSGTISLRNLYGAQTP